MAKTINPKVEIFSTLTQAQKHFDKIVSGDLLSAIGDYFVDESKELLKAWPTMYTLIKSK